MLRFSTLLVATALFALTGCTDAPTAPGDTSARFAGSPATLNAATAVYSVTVENLTTGQPFTPPVLATHRASTAIFELGEPASIGIQEIAENGANAPLQMALEDDKHVFASVTGSAPLVPAGTPGSAMFGDTDTYLIASAQGAKYLSAAWMLVCTNDGFSGLNSVRLPKKVGDTIEVLPAGYDAGTEINTEDFADIVPPCQGLIGVSSEDGGTGATNPALAEGGVVRMHPGIAGGNDLLVDPHGWSDPVARVTITRVQ